MNPNSGVVSNKRPPRLDDRSPRNAQRSGCVKIRQALYSVFDFLCVKDGIIKGITRDGYPAGLCVLVMTETLPCGISVLFVKSVTQRKSCRFVLGSWRNQMAQLRASVLWQHRLCL